MAARAKVSYFDFKTSIVQAIQGNHRRASEDKYDNKIDNEEDYRIKVGEVALAFKLERFGARAKDMRGTWSKWISFLESEFKKSDDTAKVWDEISTLSPGKITNLKTGTTHTEHAYAVHYRLHCEFGYPKYAKDIDEKVFGAAYEVEFHEPVFEETRKPVAPSAPFSHPPYHLYDDIQDELRTTPANGIWLDPHNHHSIPLSGRDAEQATLTQFMNAPEPFLILPLIAPSGAGKTRLISQWMRQYVPSASDTEWDAGFVDSTRQNSRDPQPWCDWEITRPTLIVIDYTFAYDAVVREIAERARRNPTQHKIRLVVIDHIYPKFLKDDHFWGKAFGSPGHLNILERTIIHSPIELRPEIAGSKLLRDVIAAAASLGDKTFPEDDMLIIEAEGYLTRMGETAGDETHGNPNAVRHPLFAALMGQAIREAEGETVDFSNWTLRDLITYYFAGENRLPWKVWKGGRGVSVGALVCAATLRRGLLIDTQIRRNLAKNAGEVIDYAKRVVSSDNKFIIKPFLPDILGEAFLLFYLEIIENNKKAYKNFIKLIGNSADDGEDHQIAANFQESIVRLARNLANDDQAIPAVQQGWRVLSHFLNPDRFKPDTALRLAVSYAIADVMEQIAEIATNPSRRSEKNEPKMADEHIEALKNVQLSIAAQFSISEMETLSNKSSGFPAYLPYFRFHQFSPKVRKLKEAYIDEPCILERFATRLESDMDSPLSALILACNLGYLKVAKDLHRLGWSLDGRSKSGETPLTAAISSGNVEIVNFLYLEGVNIHVETRYGWTPMMWAVQKGQINVLKFLQSVGADIHQVTSVGRTSLLATACLIDNFEAVEYIATQHGYDLGKIDRRGRTAISYTRETSRSRDFLKQLISTTV